MNYKTQLLILVLYVQTELTVSGVIPISSGRGRSNFNKEKTLKPPKKFIERPEINNIPNSEINLPFSPPSTTDQLGYYSNQWAYVPYYGISCGNPYGFGGFKCTTNTSQVIMDMLLSLSNNNNNFHLYHSFGAHQDTTNPRKPKIKPIFGRSTCIMIYNARNFSKWAKEMLKNVEQYTNPQNFTLKTGKIIHNELVLITCCGEQEVPYHVDSYTNGDSPDTNCVSHIAQIPFSEMDVL